MEDTPAQPGPKSAAGRGKWVPASVAAIIAAALAVHIPLMIEHATLTRHVAGGVSAAVAIFIMVGMMCNGPEIYPERGPRNLASAKEYATWLIPAALCLAVGLALMVSKSPIDAAAAAATGGTGLTALTATALFALEMREEESTEE